MLRKRHTVFIGLLIISLFFVFTYKNVIFQEGNPIPIFKGILELSASSNDFIPISTSGGDKFVTRSSTNHQALLSYAQTQGWTYIDQLGAGIMFETYTKAITVISRMYTRNFVIYTVTWRDKINSEVLVSSSYIPSGDETMEILKNELLREKEVTLKRLEGLQVSHVVYKTVNRPGIGIERARQIIMQTTYEKKLGSLIELGAYIEAEADLPKDKRQYIFYFNDNPQMDNVNDFVVAYIDYKNLQHFLLCGAADLGPIGKMMYDRSLSGWAFREDGLSNGNYANLLKNFIKKNESEGVVNKLKKWKVKVYERSDKTGYFVPVTKGKGLGGKPIRDYLDTPQLP